MPFQPTILYPLTLPALLQFILTSWPNTAPVTLLVCSSREAFLQDLARCARNKEGPDAQTLEQLIEPTLRNLLMARHVDLTFCASVPALLAYLSAYSGPAQKSWQRHQAGTATLVLVNTLSLHEPAPSFSAQGLSRTFAAAVETAIRVGAKLIMAETTDNQLHGATQIDDETLDVPMQDAREEDIDVSNTLGPWDQDVPIMNNSTRRFARRSGEQSWAGRTVKVSRVAARWFRFCNVSNASPDVEQK